MKNHCREVIKGLKFLLAANYLILAGCNFNPCPEINHRKTLIETNRYLYVDRGKNYGGNISNIKDELEISDTIQLENNQIAYRCSVDMLETLTIFDPNECNYATFEELIHYDDEDTLISILNNYQLILSQQNVRLGDKQYFGLLRNITNYSVKHNWDDDGVNEIINILEESVRYDSSKVLQISQEKVVIDSIINAIISDTPLIKKPEVVTDGYWDFILVLTPKNKTEKRILIVYGPNRLLKPDKWIINHPRIELIQS